MALSTTKVVQSYIQLLVDVCKYIQLADIKAQIGKNLFDTKNPSLTGTNITSAQITAVNTMISNLNTLANSATVTAILNKNQPSHNTEALN